MYDPGNAPARQGAASTSTPPLWPVRSISRRTRRAISAGMRVRRGPLRNSTIPSAEKRLSVRDRLASLRRSAWRVRASRSADDRGSPPAWTDCPAIAARPLPRPIPDPPRRDERLRRCRTRSWVHRAHAVGIVHDTLRPRCKIAQRADPIRCGGSVFHRVSSSPLARSHRAAGSPSRTRRDGPCRSLSCANGRVRRACAGSRDRRSGQSQWVPATTMPGALWMPHGRALRGNPPLTRGLDHLELVAWIISRTSG